MKVRARFAPSPTGSLHIGGIRTALYNYALAHKHGGKFILRLEDTDQGRFVPGADQEIYDMLKAYGVEPDESSIHGGDFGPYAQSQRLELYKKYAEQLVDAGHAYYCFLGEEEAKELQETARLQKVKFRSPHRELDVESARARIAAGDSYVIRQRMPEDRVVEFNDGLQGHMKFMTNEVDDGVLLKSDGFPTYHLAVVVDDHLMEITHVFRGTEWISSIPKHLLLYEAFGWEMPEFYHVSTILDPNGGKLSKRKGAVSAHEFLVQGYLPEAVLNFLMLLGWAAPLERHRGEHEQEIFSLEEFTQLFDLKHLNKSNPIFDREKLLWFNAKYVNTMNSSELAERYSTWLADYAVDKSILENVKMDDSLEKKVALVGERVKLLSEMTAMLNFFYARPENIDWEIKQLEKIDREKIASMRTKLYEVISALPDDSTSWVHEEWEQGVRAAADEVGLKHGDAFMVLRVAVVGGPVSPPLFESLQILGKAETLSRLSA